MRFELNVARPSWVKRTAYWTFVISTLPLACILSWFRLAWFFSEKIEEDLAEQVKRM